MDKMIVTLMSIPKDQKMYNTIKKKIYKSNPVHSAYRSGAIVKEYKKQFKKKYPKKEPYYGKQSNKQGLLRWFAENWKSDTGDYFYKSKSSVYRPTKRITEQTPKTFSELGSKKIKIAKLKKYRKGRVDAF